MIRVAIVEDDAEVQGVLQEYVRRYTRQYGTEFEVTLFADGVDILDDYRAVYDIIFLDVEMKHLDDLTVPVEGGLRRLDTASIYYLESEGHRVHFYTDERDFSAPGALKTFEEKLAACPFARCNSGYLVNLAQVRELRQSTVQVGPCELQVSRPKRKAFLAALTDYIGGEGS